MKLGKFALIGIIEILRKGLVEGVDVSELLKELDLEEKDGVLTLSANNPQWIAAQGE